MILHGIDNPQIHQRDGLGKRRDDDALKELLTSEHYNPPFTGTIDSQYLDDALANLSKRSCGRKPRSCRVSRDCGVCSRASKVFGAVPAPWRGKRRINAAHGGGLPASASVMMFCGIAALFNNQWDGVRPADAALVAMLRSRMLAQAVVLRRIWALRVAAGDSPMLRSSPFGPVMSLIAACVAAGDLPMLRSSDCRLSGNLLSRPFFDGSRAIRLYFVQARRTGCRMNRLQPVAARDWPIRRSSCTNV